MTYRVLHLVHSNQRRGAEVFASQLASNLSKEDFESALCVLHPTGDKELPTDGIRTFKLPGKNSGKGVSGIFDWAKVLGLRKVMHEFQPDVLLAHGSSALKYGGLSRLFYRKSVSVYRNIGMASFWANSASKVRFNRVMLDRFDKVVSLSETVRDDFLSVYRMDPDKVVIIPNGVESSAFDAAGATGVRSEYRQSLGLGDDDVVIISVGGLWPEKNQQQLIDMVKDIKSESESVKLLLVGDGPMQGDLQEMAARLEVRDSVVFLGVRDDVPNLLAMSDLFVLPSTTESMPAVLIEAGFAGLGAVAYDIGAIGDVILDGSTGIMVTEGDYRAFRNAVVQLIKDRPRREQLGRAARQRSRDLFDVSKVAWEYEKVFSGLLSRETAGSADSKLLERDGTAPTS